MPKEPSEKSPKEVVQLFEKHYKKQADPALELARFPIASLESWKQSPECEKAGMRPHLEAAIKLRAKNAEKGLVENA